LIDAKDFRDLNLTEGLFPDHLAELRDQLSPQKGVFGLTHADICEHIVAALDIMKSVLSHLFCPPTCSGLRSQLPSEAFRDQPNVMLRSSALWFGFLLGAMQNVNPLFELDRVYRSIRIAVMILDDRQYARAAEAFQRFSIGVLFASLSGKERCAHVVLDGFGKASHGLPAVTKPSERR
jgi:hypothetical protein